MVDADIERLLRLVCTAKRRTPKHSTIRSAFEVELGGDQAIERAAASLLKLAERVDPAVRDRLRALAVVTATGGYAYQRPDTVSVIPIATLSP